MYKLFFTSLFFFYNASCSENSGQMSTSSNQKERQGEGAFGNEDLGQRGWVGQIYRLPIGTESLPNFRKMSPIGSIVTPQLNIAPRSFSAGFPNVPDLVEWFGIRFEGTLIIPKTGCKCEFFLNSDDGSKLVIDENLVIDNDGTHMPQEKSGIIDLDEGDHSIRVDYFQGPRDQIALQLFMRTSTNDSIEIIPTSMIDRPGK